MIKLAILLAMSLYVSILEGFAQNEQIKKSLTDLVTWFNPHMGNAYQYYPLYGTAKIGEYTITDGKLVSYGHESKRESNGKDATIDTSELHDIHYSDSLITVTCNFCTRGFHSGKKETSHSHSYPITSLTLVSDSTIYYCEAKWQLTAINNHWSNNTGYPNDLWNVEVVFEKGMPVKIRRGTEVTSYQYLEFDRFNNWTKRTVIDENGNSRIQVRSIEYSCEQCGGKGSFYGRCMKCYGTGRCKINPHGSPDEAVGMCPYCGGKGKGIEKCKQCK